MIDQDFSRPHKCFFGCNRAVCPDFKCQLVKVRDLSDTRIFDLVVDLFHRRKNGIHRDDTDRRVCFFILVRALIADARVKGETHEKRTVAVHMRDDMIRIHNFEFITLIKLTGGHRAFVAGFLIDKHRFGARHMKACTNILNIQKDFGDIFHHTGHGRIFLKNAFNSDGRGRASRK